MTSRTPAHEIGMAPWSSNATDRKTLRGADMTADKTGTASDENGFHRQLSVRLKDQRKG
jgi:hypothetical protein